MSIVQTDSGYRMRYEHDSDGVYPIEYRLFELYMPSDRVPEAEKDELHRMAFSRWHQRDHDES